MRFGPRQAAILSTSDYLDLTVPREVSGCIGAQRLGDSAMSDTSQGEGWWQASDGKWYGPDHGAVVMRPQPVPSLAVDPFSPSDPPSTLVGRLGKKRWPFVLIPGLIVCIAAILVVTLNRSEDTKSYLDGYRYGVSVEPWLGNSHSAKGCGGDENVPSGDDVNQWQKGCQDGWAYEQHSATERDGGALPPSASSTATPPTSAASPTSTGSSTSTTTTAPPNAIQDLSPVGTFGIKPTVTVPPGPPPSQLESTDLIVGTGTPVGDGDTLVVQYVLASYSTGKIVESSWDVQPLSFTLGSAEVFPGWNQGLTGMRVGGRRELIVPPTLAYGDQPPIAGIADNDALVFIVDLLSVAAGPDFSGNSGNAGTVNTSPPSVGPSGSTGPGNTGDSGNTGTG